jgi:hypothetical protein
MQRRTFIKNAEIASGMMLVSPILAKDETPEEYDFPLMDLHVHLTNEYTIERIMQIAIEINDMAHTPHDKFILMAKAQGLKFTFGSDSRNQNAGRLPYSKAAAKKCNLKKEDFYIPGKN